MSPLRRTSLTVIYEDHHEDERSRQTDDESIGTKHSINSYRTFAHSDDPTYYTRPSTIAAVIKIQAFVRSALTRQRVCNMVDKLIEQLKRQLAVIKLQAFVRSGLTRIRVCKMLDELIADLKRQIEQRKEQIRQEHQHREQQNNQNQNNESSMSSLFGSFFSTSSSSLNSLSSPTRTMRKLLKKKRKFDVIKETLEDSLQFKPPLTISQSLCDNPLHVQEQMLLKGSAREVALSRWKLVKLAMKFVTNLKEVTEHKISIGVVKPEIKVMILQGQLEINRGIPTQQHRESFTPLMEQAASIGKRQRLTEKIIETTKEEEVVEDDSDDEEYEDDVDEGDYYIDLNGTSNDNGSNPTTAEIATSPSSESTESSLKQKQKSRTTTPSKAPPKATTMSPKWSRKQKVHLPKITGRRSKEQHVLLEAVAMGRIRRLKPQVTTNYDVTEDDEDDEKANGKKKDILDWWDPDNEVHYDSLEDVPLPTQELPKTPLMRLSNASANTSTTNHMQELHVRKKHNLFDDDALNNSKMATAINNKNRKSSLASLGVAEAACDRERRLFSKSATTSTTATTSNNNINGNDSNHSTATDPTMMDMDHTKLRMTQKCACKYCKTSNPYQTNAYRKLWLKQRGLLMPSKMNLAALSKKFEKNNKRR